MWHDDYIVKPFRIFNTLSRTVEELKPGNPPDITYYSCGPTVYLPQHLGNMRAYLFVDTLKRALRFNGWNVRHVMNITDVGHMTSDEDAGEDKIEKTARAEGKTPLEVANFYIEQFKRDCSRLNIELPQLPLLCRATDHIGDMIALIERILRNGLAYVTPSGVYFDVEKWRGPGGRGRLSRQSLDEQQGNRLEHSPDKRSPYDFALWVLDQPHHMMQWDSPWGRGYPGWHIECSAMSMKYLGETIDIHSGGLDHIPVHHENEIAQSEGATGQPFVRYFVHNAFLVGMEGAKISKSAGRFPTLDSIVDNPNDAIMPLAFRTFCLGAKYRSELAFSMDALRAAEKNLYYFYTFARAIDDLSASQQDSDWTQSFKERFHDAINDDLNTPRALAVALELVGTCYKRGDDRIWNTLGEMGDVLGLRIREHRANPGSGWTAEVERLAERREEARRSRDFVKADEYRNQIFTMGFVIEDTAKGYRLKKRQDLED